MPNKDGTGPEGKGPRTGRQMGDCKNAEPVVGRGLGPCGRGLGRGRGFGFRARAMQTVPMQQVQPIAVTEKQEKQFLEQELTAVKEEMKEIEERLKKIKK